MRIAAWDRAISRRAAALLGALLAAAFAAPLLGVDVLRGIHSYWAQPWGDAATNLVGLLYYVQDSWRFPLFSLPQLGFPEGGSVVYTDSIPLLALVLKIWFKLTGWFFNGIGAWVFLCFVLTGTGMAMVLHRLGVRQKLIIACGVLLAVSAPFLLIRIGHAALMGQFLLLFALDQYVSLTRADRPWRAVAWLTLLTVLGLMIQAYFAPMVFVFLIAALAQRVLDRRTRLAAALLAAAASTAAALLAAVLFGIITPGSPAPVSGGFGYFSMNLLSPFLPPRSLLPSAWAGRVQWGANQLTWDATGGQDYEGYGYLGLSVLALLLATVGLAPGQAWAVIRRHRALGLGLVGLTLYALSDKIYLGDILLADIPLPNNPLTGMLRTGGRCFWPVYYVLIAFLILFWVRRLRPRAALLLLGAVTLGQLAETQIQRNYLQNFLTSRIDPQIDEAAWTDLVARHRFVKQFPSHQCGGWAAAWPGINAGLELMLITARHNIPINSAYLARQVKNCSREADDAFALTLKQGGLYIYLDTMNLSFIPSSFGDWCRQFDRGVVCTRAWPALAGDPALSGFKPLAGSRERPYRLGEVLHFVPEGAARRYELSGWSVPETIGTWTVGDEAHMRLDVPPASPDLQLLVTASPYLFPAHDRIEVRVAVNETALATWIYRLDEPPAERLAVIPQAAIAAADGHLDLSFTFDHPAAPSASGQSSDTRALGILMESMTISPRSAL